MSENLTVNYHDTGVTKLTVSSFDLERVTEWPFAADLTGALVMLASLVTEVSKDMENCRLITVPLRGRHFVKDFDEDTFAYDVHCVLLEGTCLGWDGTT